jgi:hypothetical protein
MKISAADHTKHYLFLSEILIYKVDIYNRTAEYYRNRKGGEKKKMKKAILKFLATFAAIAIIMSMSATASEADVTVTTVAVSPKALKLVKM